MVKATLLRPYHEEVQTLGTFIAFNDDREEFNCKTLELPDLNNAKYISRIPSGIYCVQKRYSKTFGYHYHVKDVIGRTVILFHAGNSYHQTEGCILVGSDYYDIDNDGNLDVTNSVRTLGKMLAFCGDEFELRIIDL